MISFWDIDSSLYTNLTHVLALPCRCILLSSAHVGRFVRRVVIQLFRQWKPKEPMASLYPVAVKMSSSNPAKCRRVGLVRRHFRADHRRLRQLPWFDGAQIHRSPFPLSVDALKKPPPQSEYAVFMSQRCPEGAFMLLCEIAGEMRTVSGWMQRMTSGCR